MDSLTKALVRIAISEAKEHGTTVTVDGVVTVSYQGSGEVKLSM